MTTAALTMTGDCTLVARPHPFDSNTAFAQVPAGQTLAQMLGPDASHSLQVAIGGHEVPSSLWAVTRPKAGQTIHVTNYPQGGNAGKWVRLVLTVVLMYFTYGASGWAASASTAFGGSAAMWGAAFMLVGQLAITPMVGQPLEVLA
ncbi:hypothetical protein HFP05_01080 [Rhodanobacter denitrificans]|jgi:hypothetical protein|nr:hypothetical protein [Rhodanobacter denitrificans]